MASVTATWQQTPERAATSSVAARDVAVASLFLGGGLGLYLWSLRPGFSAGDSGEFHVLGYQFGITHAPGHPLYIALAKAVTWLPVSDVAFRVTLLSAVMAAVCVATVYLTSTLLTGSRIGAAFGALALALSSMFRSQAVIAEVYTSAAAMLSLSLLWLVLWKQTGRTGFVFAAALAGGLGVGIHGTVGLAAGPAVMFLWLNRNRGKSPWLAAIAGGALGLAVNAALLVAADLNSPPANIFNVVYGPSRSLWHVSQDGFSTVGSHLSFLVHATPWRALMLTGWGAVPTHFVEYLTQLPQQFTIVGLVLGLLGLASLLEHGDVSLRWLLIGSLVLNWIFTFTYQIPDIQTFYIPGYMLIALLTAYGGSTVSSWSASVRHGGVLGAIAGSFLLAATVVPRLAPLWTSGDADASLTRGLSDDVRRQLDGNVDALPTGATIFLDWSQLYAYIYAAQIERQRFDLHFVEAKPYSSAPGLATSLVEFARGSLSRGPVFFSRRWPDLEAGSLTLTLANVGSTHLYRLHDPQHPRPEEAR